MEPTYRKRAFWTTAPDGEDIQVLLYYPDTDPEMPLMCTEYGDEVIKLGDDFVIPAKRNMILTNIPKVESTEADAGSKVSNP